MKPQVVEIKLEKEYRFMYANFVISSQHKLYLLLAKKDDDVDALEFDFVVYKYGYPNDEVEHPLMKYGLGFYGFYEVLNSTWIENLRMNNSSHFAHSDKFFHKMKHYVVKFKDVTLEVISFDYALKRLPKSFFSKMLNEEINFLDTNED